mgnify:CR=1 FL=1
MFYKIFNQKMTSTESNYIGSAIKGNTLTMMSKGFKGEFYDRQVKYANKMQSGLATAVTVTEAQLNFLLKDVQFMGILAKVNALSELDSKSEITKDEPEFVCSDNMGNPLHVGDKPVVSFEEKLGGTKRRRIVRKTKKGMYFEDNNYLSFEHLHRICG